MSHTFVLPAEAKAPRKPSMASGSDVIQAKAWNVASALSRSSIVLLDLFVVAFTYYIAVRILLSYTTLRMGIAYTPMFVVLVIATKGMALWHFGVFKGSLRYAGVRELLGLVAALFVSAVLLFAVSHVAAAGSSVPMPLFLLDASLCGIAL